MRFSIGALIIILGLYCSGCMPSLMNSIRTPSERYVTHINNELEQAVDYRHEALLKAGVAFRLGNLSVYYRNQFVVLGDSLQQEINKLTDALLEFKIYRTGEKKLKVEETFFEYESSLAQFKKLVKEVSYED